MMSTQSEPQRPKKYWRDDEEVRWAVKQWATKMGVKEPPVRFQMMTAKWGTITPSGWLTLDPTLLTLPRHLGEMVVVHELEHGSLLGLCGVVCPLPLYYALAAIERSSAQ